MRGNPGRPRWGGHRLEWNRQSLPIASSRRRCPVTLPSTAHDARPVERTSPPAVSLRGARLSFGERTLWSGLDLDVAPGEFIAVLGPNGSGKTSLVRVLLGLQALSAGEVRVAGREPRRGSPHIGYIPQQKALDPDLPLRGRDLVGLGLDGHRLGHRAARAAGAPGAGRRGAGRGRRHELRGRTGRAAVRRRAAAAAGGPGAGRRPGGAAVRRAAALARPGPPGHASPR